VTRIVAGSAGGRRLVVPSGQGVRPTSERAREGLFSALEAARGGLAGARVLDLYAGSGAVGLEALSRGASAALLVETDRRALAALAANVGSLDLPGAAICPVAVERLATQEPPGPPYDVCFADPPYALTGLPEILARLADAGWLAAAALVAVERSRRDPPFGWPPGWEPLRARRYGEAVLWYGRARR
jgi:16S rRNA (guanine966-N2)-methyltransferase